MNKIRMQNRASRNDEDLDAEEEDLGAARPRGLGGAQFGGEKRKQQQQSGRGKAKRKKWYKSK